MDLTRRRRHHTRSRGGCKACKDRHVRCDELRPACAACLIRKMECQYAAETLSLADQNWIQLSAPGVSIWAVNMTADPFDSLPIKMPFKSQDLLRYFAGSESVFSHMENGRMRNFEQLSVMSKTPQAPKIRDDCVALTTKEDITLRSTLLMAGLHYSWRTGGLFDFEKSFLFHKGELIHRVNAWLVEDPGQISVDCLKQIAILSISESCAGNYPTAETHLNGLLTVLEMKEGTSSQDETLDRLILVAHHFASAVKSRLRTAPNIEDTDQARIWQRSFTGLPENLVALRLIPYYFPRYDCTPRTDVDARDVISALQSITEAVINRTEEVNTHYLHDGGLASEQTICDSYDPATCTGCKSLSALLLAFTEAHVSSLSPKSEDLEWVVPSSWCSLAAAAALYLNYALRLWNWGQPVDRRLHRMLLDTILRDLMSSENERSRNELTDKLWLWKAFLAAYATEMSEYNASVVDLTQKAHDVEDQLRLKWLHVGLQRWSQTNGITQWDAVKLLLAEIAWPLQSDSNDQNVLARQIWVKFVPATA